MNGSRALGQYVQVVNADGPVICVTDASINRPSAPMVNTLTTVDGDGYLGWYPSATVDSNGLPIISYYDATNLDRKLAHCDDAACTSATITGTIGQPDAGTPLAGGDYQLSGRFWQTETGGAPPEHHLFPTRRPAVRAAA